MGSSRRQVRVVVEGREYVVEVGDLSERPIHAMVNQRSYQVQVGEIRDAKPSETRPQEIKDDIEHPMTSSVHQTKKTLPAQEFFDESVMTAPMPGDILEVLVKPGDQVKVGQVLCSLEAMKMKNAIRSPCDGIIATVEVAQGQEVAYGEVLIRFE